MKLRVSAGVVFLAAALLGPVLVAQQAPLALGRHDDQVHLDVVVTGKSGGPVAGLTQQDFVVRDNKAPQTITSFQALSGKDAPVEMILVVDTVNTGYQNVAYERQQVDRFLRTEGGRLEIPTALAILTDTGMQIQPEFSRDGNALSQGLDQQTIGLRSIRRSAGFYGAEERFQISLKAMEQLTAREATRPGRKLVVWVSPGWPLLSGPRVNVSSKQAQGLFASVVDMSNRLRQARVTLYSVDPLGAGDSVFRTSYYKQFVKGVRRPNDVDAGDLGLQVLATQTGGLVLQSSNDIAAMLRQTMEDARSFYEISYAQPPSEGPNQYHQVEVEVGKPGLTARALQGYYSSR